MKKIVIAGAGLCGSLLAMRLAQLGYTVDVYERRSDPRKNQVDGGRSINLALSDRGLKALAMVGLSEEVQKLMIPMYGRMIHPQDHSKEELYKYSGREGEHINSISRSGLNELLLTEADKMDGVHLFFDSKVEDYNFDSTSAVAVNIKTEERTPITADVIFATDGAGSEMRKSMMQFSNAIRFNFSQSYLDTGYKELSLPAVNDDWAIFKNALHIWPRDGFMMIALPNLDKTFTLTLFYPYEGKHSLASLSTDEKVMQFIQEQFPDLSDHHDHLLNDYNENPMSSLGTIRCYPWRMNRCLLMGDSAHAIVPFYGQGMNCAFEDVYVLDQLIHRYDHDWDQILEAYQRERKKDTDAIADLAEDNFYEMRDSTADPVFNVKRKLELQLEQDYPAYYSKYSLVTFKEDIPYHQARNQGRKQDEILMEIARDVNDLQNIDLQDVMDILNQKI